MYLLRTQEQKLTEAASEVVENEMKVFFLFTQKWALLMCEHWCFEGHTVVCRSHRGTDGTHAPSRASLTEAGKGSLPLMKDLITHFVSQAVQERIEWPFFDSLSNLSHTLDNAVP